MFTLKNKAMSILCLPSQILVSGPSLLLGSAHCQDLQKEVSLCLCKVTKPVSVTSMSSLLAEKSTEISLRVAIWSYLQNQGLIENKEQSQVKVYFPIIFFVFNIN